MKFKTEDLHFLQDKNYTSGHRFFFELDAEDKVYISRNDMLANIVSGKKVIHFGCVDHDIESIVNKIQSGNWLHQILIDNAIRCAGIDIKEQECLYITNKLGIDDIECVNILESESVLLHSDNWDYILLPDIIEHISNPGSFLKALQQSLPNFTGKIIITTPNGLAESSARRAIKGYELINTDHRMFFTPFTLSKLMVEAGYKIQHIRTCRHGHISKQRWLKNWLFGIHPLVRDCLVVIATI